MSKHIKLLLSFGLLIAGFSLVAMKRGRDEGQTPEVPKRARPSMASLAGLPEEIKLKIISQEVDKAPTLRAKLAAIVPFRVINKQFYRIATGVENNLLRNLIMPHHNEYTIKNVFGVSKEELLADPALLRTKVIHALRTINTPAYQHLLGETVALPRIRIMNDKAGEDEFTTNNGIVFLLLKLGIDPNTIIHGEPIIFNALDNKNLEVARALFAAGARTDVIGKNGFTPLIEEILQGTPEAVALVLQYDPNPGYGNPLHQVAELGDIEKAQLLLDKGININYQDRYGRTPLHIAAMENETQMVEFLLANGADPHLVNNNGFKPRDITENSEIRAMLTQAMDE